MRNWFLALMAAFGLAFTMTACGDDDEPTSCETSDDCADNEQCDTSCRLCAVTDDLCTSDTQCSTGETCLPFSEGCTLMKCQAGEGPGPLTCTDETFSVCYDAGQFCASDENGLNGTCEDLDIGSCNVGGHSAPSANGPMIFYVESQGACVPNATECGGTGTACAFNVYFWDPQGDVDAEYADVKYINGAGSVGAIGNTSPGTITDLFGSVVAITCVGESPNAVLIQDNAGNMSNGVCLAGR